MTDWFTEELFDLPGARRVVFPVSRLVVDPERFQDDAQEVMAGRGMGVIYTRTSQGKTLRPEPSRAIRARLIDFHYTPHHAALARAVDNVLAVHPTCLVVDCHSFPSRPLPYETDQRMDRPQICLGTDAFHTPRWLAEGAVSLFGELGLVVDIDRPFAGALVPEKHYRRDQRVLALMVEINRATYMDEAQGHPLPTFDQMQKGLGEVLSALIELVHQHGQGIRPSA